MYRIDYHLHTAFSSDSQMSMGELCDTALREGLQEICITDHTEFGHPDPVCNVPLDVPGLLLAIAEARLQHPALVIRAGVEIGDNPSRRDEIKQWHAGIPFDFKLLSLHLVDGEDPYMPDVFTGKKQDSFYRRYVESKLESVLAWEPESFDAVSHLGYCAKFAPYPREIRPLRYHHAPDAFDCLFMRLASFGKALEINTSGLRSIGECFPDRELLKRFHELGGEFVTLGSDAHKPSAVGAGLVHARELARGCGFRFALTFDQRRPIPVVL